MSWPSYSGGSPCPLQPCSEACPASNQIRCRAPTRLSGTSLTLRLLAQLLWAPAGRSAARAAHDAGALSLLLRAVLTGTQLLAASHADDQWGVLAGDSLDAADSMEGRRAALEFLGAAAAAMSTFLQHLRM